MLAIREIWGNFRDDGGVQHFGPQAVAGELAVVQQVLEYGQAGGSLGQFDARVMAVTIKASLDALLNQFATDPELDLDAYGAELVRLFDRTTRKGQTRPYFTFTVMTSEQQCGEIGRVREIRLEPLGGRHLDDVRDLVADPTVLRFIRIPEPLADDFAEPWIAGYERG
jgi:hypothetical protein